MVGRFPGPSPGNGHQDIPTGPGMTRRVILAGGGHAHLAVLADWARQPLPGTERLLITASRHTAYSGMLPGWLAGIYRTRDLLIDLEPLARRAGARLLVADVIGLDAGRRTLSLSSGEEVEFDLLSLATGGETDISSLALLGDRLLPVRPMAALMQRWSHFLEANLVANLVASSPAAPLSVAVVGGGAGGVELALGAERALSRLSGKARICLVTPSDSFLAGHACGVRRRARAELAKRGIAIHFAHAAGQENGLLLSNGDFLPADRVIAATGSRAPPWLAASGLACTTEGFVAVGSDMRSTSHAAIFAAGDIIDRVDRHLPRSGVHAVKAGPVVAFNLRATISGAALHHYRPGKRTLYLLALGDRRAILSWGGLALTGKLAWWIKDWIDRGFVGRYTEADRDRG